MAQPPHFNLDNHIYFITTSTSRRRKFFKNEKIAQIVRDMLISKEEEWGYKLYSYVIMPDHLHMMVRLKNERHVSELVKQIKGFSSYQINLYRKLFLSGSPPFSWQKGFFDNIIRDEKSFRKKFNYIHYNPVRSGIVDKAEKYKFSSAGLYRSKYGEVFYS